MGFSLSKLESTKCVTVISLNQLCLTSNPHSSCWLAGKSMPASLGLAPRAICGLLGPATVGLWFFPSLKPPPCFSPEPGDTAETRFQPRTTSLCTYHQCYPPWPVLGSPPLRSTPLPSPLGMNEVARKGRVCRNLFIPSFLEHSWKREENAVRIECHVSLNYSLSQSPLRWSSP